MKTFLFYLLLALIALSLQATLFKGIKPDLVLILVCFYSLRYGEIKGMTYGALTGVLIDSASGFILGPNIISKSLAGFLMKSIRQKLFHWNVIISTVIIIILSVIDIFLVYISLETFSKVSFVNRSLRILIMQVIYTAVLALILYPVLNPEKDNKLGFK
jgi:rod shape-determining protein MreD